MSVFGGSRMLFLFLATAVPTATGDRADQDELKAGASALGYRQGDLLFGQYRLLEHLGSAPIEGPPAQGGGPGEIGRHRAEGGRSGQAAALLERGRQGLAPASGPGSFPLDGKFTRVGLEAEGEEDVGAGSIDTFRDLDINGVGFSTGDRLEQFAESWLVELKNGLRAVVKVLYMAESTNQNEQPKIFPITTNEIRNKARCAALGTGNPCAKSAARAHNECRLLKTIVDQAVDQGKAEYITRIRRCLSFSPELPVDDYGIVKHLTGARNWFETELDATKLDDEPIHSVLEFGGEDNLATRILSGFFSTPARAKRAARQLAEALDLLVGSRVSHHNVRPETVMVEVEAGAEEEFSLKLSDFSHAEELLEEAWKDAHSTSTVRRGNLYYYVSPPEYAMMPRKELPCKADIFALGVLLFQLLIGSKTVLAQAHFNGGRMTKFVSSSPRGIEGGFNVFTLADLDGLLNSLAGDENFPLLAQVMHDQEFNFPQPSVDPEKNDGTVLQADAREGAPERDFLHNVLLQMVNFMPDSKPAFNGRPTPQDVLSSQWLRERPES